MTNWQEWTSEQEKFISFFNKKKDVILTTITKDFMDFIFHAHSGYSNIKHGLFTIKAGFDWAANKNCIYITKDNEKGYAKFHEDDIIGFGEDGTLYGVSNND